MEAVSPLLNRRWILKENFINSSGNYGWIVFHSAKRPRSSGAGPRRTWKAAENQNGDLRSIWVFMGEKQQPRIRSSKLESQSRERCEGVLFFVCVLDSLAVVRKNAAYCRSHQARTLKSPLAKILFFENTIKRNFFSFLLLPIKSCTFGKIGCLNYRHFSSSRQLLQKHKQKKTLLDCKDEHLYTGNDNITDYNIWSPFLLFIQSWPRHTLLYIVHLVAVYTSIF